MLLSLVMLRAAVGLIVLRVSVVRLAFERGSFDADETQLTATALACYGVGLFRGSQHPYSQPRILLSARLIDPSKSKHRGRPGEYCLGVVLVKPMGHGGIALAFSLALLGNMICLSGYCARRPGKAWAFSLT